MRTPAYRGEITSTSLYVLSNVGQYIEHRAPAWRLELEPFPVCNLFTNHGDVPSPGHVRGVTSGRAFLLYMGMLGCGGQGWPGRKNNLRGGWAGKPQAWTEGEGPWWVTAENVLEGDTGELKD